MDFLIGIVGDGFVLTAADCSQARSVVLMKNSKREARLCYMIISNTCADQDKMQILGKNLLMLSSGPGMNDCNNR